MNKTELLCKLCIQNRDCRLDDIYNRLLQFKENKEEKDNYIFLKDTKVRFLNPQGDFDYAKLFEFVKVNNDFYILSNREGYREYHNGLLSNEEMKGYKYLVKIIYAGIYSYRRDLYGNRIYLYDIVGGYNSNGRYLSGVVTIDEIDHQPFLAVDTWINEFPMFIDYDDNPFFIRPDTLKVLGHLAFSRAEIGSWPKGFDASEKAYIQAQNNVV